LKAWNLLIQQQLLMERVEKELLRIFVEDDFERVLVRP
jgi:hypothetical protein